MDKQAVLNAIWEHAVTNKAKAGLNPHTKLCMYRGNEKKTGIRRCWIGALIPDNFYNRKVENLTAGLAMFELDLDEMFEEGILDDVEYHYKGSLHNKDNSWLRQLQKLHDGMVEAGNYAQAPPLTRSNMARRVLGRFAALHGLEIPLDEKKIEETVSVDADNSMASIGDIEKQTRIFGTRPVKCTSLHKLRDLLVQLVDRDVVDEQHEMFEMGTSGVEGMEFAYKFNERARANGLWGIAVDTWSHMSSKSMASIVYKAHGEPFPHPIDLGVYNTLGQLAGSILRIVENANFPVIVNSHMKEVDGPTGRVMLPDMSGAMRKRLPEGFDIVLFADKKKVKDKGINYIWHTRGTGKLSIAKVRLPEVKEALDDKVPQDLNRIITLCEKAGKPDPKILILADTGYGKTSALATINGLVAPHFNTEE